MAMAKTVAAGKFKQTCLALLDEVAESGVEYIVTKRGKPVARVSPLGSAREREGAILARLRAGTRVLCEDDVLVAPSSKLAKWRSRG
jgi:prevent-host-death family protein